MTKSATVWVEPRRNVLEKRGEMPTQDQSSKNTSTYANTHCRICDYGWTRRDEAGDLKIVCLLDREPVWPAMEWCSRFEDTRNKQEQQPLRPKAEDDPE